MRYYLRIILLSTCWALIAFLAAGCGSNSPVDSGSGNDIPDRYTIETEPSLSPDRNYVYYVAVDTTSLNQDGIWRARKRNPIRELMLPGDGFHSPILAFGNSIIAYLKSSKINFYEISSDSSWSSEINEGFESIIYIRGGLLLGCRRDSIFVIDEVNQTSNFLTYGWDPTYISPENFAYMTETNEHGVNEYKIVKSFYPFEIFETVFDVDNVLTGSKPRWPTMEPTKNRIAYVIDAPGANLVYAAEKNGFSSHLIDTSLYNKAYIIDYNSIIYTGKDGRFYLSNFSGTIKMPYWGAVKE